MCSNLRRLHCGLLQQDFPRHPGPIATSAAGTLTGALRNLELVEGTIDPNTFVSTPVAERETRCITDYNFSVIISSP